MRVIECPSLEEQHNDMGLFMCSLMRAAIHLGRNYDKNLDAYKFTTFEQIENLFTITHLVMENSLQILKVTTI